VRTLDDPVVTALGHLMLCLALEGLCDRGSLHTPHLLQLPPVLNIYVGTDAPDQFVREQIITGARVGQGFYVKYLIKLLK
jgi:hypothetical protein